MDILELIDLEHPNNQQDVRPFPCNWEGCTKVPDALQHIKKTDLFRPLAVGRILLDTSVSTRMNDPSSVANATSRSFKGVH